MKELNKILFSNEENFIDWISKSEPQLVKDIHYYFFKKDLEQSYDSEENKKRLSEIEKYYQENISSIYFSLTKSEKVILYLMQNSFGWLVYDRVENLTKLIAKFFNFSPEEVSIAINSLLNRYIIFNYKRLNLYDFLYCPPVFLKYIFEYLRNDFSNNNSIEIKPENILKENYIQLIAGLISYIVNYSPRSSENNEIHKIDLEKLLEFFSDFAEKDQIERIIKKLTRFGFFQKYSNRVIINKFLFDTIVKLSVNEQLFIIFLYEFLDQLEFHKPTFMAIKILSHYYLIYKKPLPLKELFFYYINAELYFTPKNENKNLLSMLKHEEIKFMSFVRQLEHHKIAKVIKAGDTVSLTNDSIIMNEPAISLLNDFDLSSNYPQTTFVVDSNFEIFAEPEIRPDILFKVALISEPKTIQLMSIFRITKESLKKSLAYGMKKEEIIEFLRVHSKHKIPENVEKSIIKTLNEITFEEFKNYKIVQISAHFSSFIREKYKNSIIEIEPHTFLIFDENILKNIEEYCNENKVSIKYITDFLGEKYHQLVTKFQLEHNIKHLHTIKDFLNFYGSQHLGNILKVDNKI
jgi:hypothetical protein